MLSPGDCEYLNRFRKFLHPRPLPSHQISCGSICKRSWIKQKWYVFLAQQQIIYILTNWCLWAQFKSAPKGTAVMLKLDQVIPLALPSYKLGKHAVAFLQSQNTESQNLMQPRVRKVIRGSCHITLPCPQTARNLLTF